MRVTLFVFAFIFILFKSNAQITVTDVDVLAIGDMIYLPEDDNVSITPGSSGANVVWDFSSLDVTNVMTWQCVDPNTTPFGSSYPNANLCVDDFGDYLYFNKTATKVELLGQNDSTFQAPVVVLPLPLSYGLSYTDGPITALDSMISGPSVNFLLASQGLSASLITGFAAHTADTLSIQAVISTEFNVDAYGNITIPMGSFDCLRLKSERTTSTSIEIYCTDTITGAGSGWYPIPFSDMQQEVSYQWWSNDVSTKFALAEMVVDSVGNVNGGVQFLHNATNNLQENQSSLYSIYPIPATYELNIKANKLENTCLRIFDNKGSLIDELEFSQSIKVDLSSLAKGTYFINLINDNNTIRKKILIQ